MSNEERKQPNENANALGSALRDLGQQLIPRVQAFERTLRELMVAAKPYLANLVKNIEALPARAANVQRILARRGWFIPPKIPAMAFLKLVEEHSANGRMKELDELMTNYIDSQLSEIEKDLIARYPNRAALFVEASLLFLKRAALKLRCLHGMRYSLLGKSFGCCPHAGEVCFRNGGVFTTSSILLTARAMLALRTEKAISLEDG